MERCGIIPCWLTQYKAGKQTRHKHPHGRRKVVLLLTHVNAALVIPGQETPADPPPMGVTFPLRRPLALMDKENPKIGWWDAEKGACKRAAGRSAAGGCRGAARSASARRAPT